MPEPLRAVIVDDERLARERLRELLNELEGVTVAGEADDVASAVVVVQSVQPDVVFLDVAMPAASGFELLPALGSGAHVVFVTAYDEYAVRAFEVHALDYLLKPVRPERLRDTLTRLREAQPRHAADLRPLDYDDYVLLDGGKYQRFVQVRTIQLIAAAGVYTEVFTAAGEKTVVATPLAAWERRLPPRYFARVHRSTIVGLEQIDRIEKSFGRQRMYLRGLAEPVAVSRRGAAMLRKRWR
ncbi:MAG: LytTR family DNA-binding domain-containing protein [Acidobacteriota bacterium]|nr:LytTR family DNA-binding domain-containing protein [Acidobacteriota bacterium]